MKTIRIVSLLIGFGLAAAGCAAVADDSLQIAGKEVGEDGVLTRRLAEVVGDTAPTTTPTASIAAASTAVARLDGRRTGPPGGVAGVDAGAGDGPVGEVGVSGISVMAYRQAQGSARKTGSENFW